MTSVKVIITGIVMLIRGGMLSTEPSTALRGALAVEDLGPKRGTYGVMIPRHETRLVIAQSDATVISDPHNRVSILDAPAVVDTTTGAVLKAQKPFHVVSLRGD